MTDEPAARSLIPDATCCGNCRYFRRSKPGQALGVCRAWPPTLVFMGFQQPSLQGQPPIPVTSSFWPLLADTEWCGSHAPHLTPHFEEMAIGDPADAVVN